MEGRVRGKAAKHSHFPVLLDPGRSIHKWTDPICACTIQLDLTTSTFHKHSMAAAIMVHPIIAK